MRALVTGGSGFIGRHLAHALARRGAEVVNLDLVAAGHAPPFADEVIGDVRDPAAVREALAGCDLVVHLAAAHHDYGIERDTYFDVNESGARVLCAAMEREGVRRALFTSTVAVYGGGDDEPDEATVPRPTSPYGASKLAGERVFQEWAGRGESRAVTVLRPSVVFGPWHYANVYALLRQIDAGRYLQVGDGRNYKSLVYVRNLVDAALFLLDREPGAAMEVCNYVDKPDLRSAEIAALLYAALGRPVPRLRVPLGLALAMAAPLDAVSALTGRPIVVSRQRIRKLASDQTRFAARRVRDLGFVPRFSLAEGVEDMVRWYVQEGRDRAPIVHLPPAQVVVGAQTLAGAARAH